MPENSPIENDKPFADPLSAKQFELIAVHLSCVLHARPQPPLVGFRQPGAVLGVKVRPAGVDRNSFGGVFFNSSQRLCISSRSHFSQASSKSSIIR